MLITSPVRNDGKGKTGEETTMDSKKKDAYVEFLRDSGIETGGIYSDADLKFGVPMVTEKPVSRKPIQVSVEVFKMLISHHHETEALLRNWGK